MANAINTRIVLKNDTLEKWNKSTIVLLKGEAALARLDGELSDSFQVRIGTGEKTWSQLESSNIIISSRNVSGLTYDEYKLSSLQTSSGEQSKFQLVGKSSKEQVWTPIGEAIAVPEVDFTEVNSKIDYLSDAISGDISNAIDNILTSAIPAAVDAEKERAEAAERDLSEEVNKKLASTAFAQLSNDIGLSAASTDNKVVTFEDIKDLEGSMHFKGVTTMVLSTGSTDVPGDIYVSAERPKAGDVIIHEASLKEFIWGRNQ